MTFTPLVRLYLSLEDAMLAAEAIDERLADRIRDAMDPIWYALSADERKILNELPVNFIQGLRAPVTDDLFHIPVPENRRIPQEPIEDWRSAA
jgi:hypothetical protein